MRQKIGVKPAFAVPTNGALPMFSIEVVNLSSFPVTLAEVGFTVGRNRRAVVVNLATSDRKPLPRRIEAREAVSCYFDIGSIGTNKLGKAYARLSSGEFRYGSSPALKQLRQIVCTSSAK